MSAICRALEGSGVGGGRDRADSVGRHTGRGGGQGQQGPHRIGEELLSGGWGGCGFCWRAGGRVDGGGGEVMGGLVSLLCAIRTGLRLNRKRVVFVLSPPPAAAMFAAFFDRARVIPGNPCDI